MDKQAENLENIQSLTQHDFSLIGIIASGDIVSKTVIFILVICSIWSWAIIINKYIQYRDLIKKMSKFEKLFWSGQVLDDLYEKIKRISDEHALAAMFIAAMDEWKKMTSIKMNSTSAFIGIKERILRSMHVIQNREIARLEDGLGFLTAVASSGLYIGLFGTVWGIINTFPSIASAKTATLAVVAPRIAEALTATAIGLFAAIPSSIFYNYLNAKLGTIIDKIDNFSSELYTLISRAIDNEKN
jgi:biopolymer transport protein TolQ